MLFLISSFRYTIKEKENAELIPQNTSIELILKYLFCCSQCLDCFPICVSIVHHSSYSGVNQRQILDSLQEDDDFVVKACVELINSDLV